MKNKSIQVLDDMMRVLIPKGLRHYASFEKSERLTPVVNQENGTIELSKHFKGELEIDVLGRLKLNKAQYKALGWGEGDILFIRPHWESQSITLSMHQKK